MQFFCDRLWLTELSTSFAHAFSGYEHPQSYFTIKPDHVPPFVGTDQKTDRAGVSRCSLDQLLELWILYIGKLIPRQDIATIELLHDFLGNGSQFFVAQQTQESKRIGFGVQQDGFGENMEHILSSLQSVLDPDLLFSSFVKNVLDNKYDTNQLVEFVSHVIHSMDDTYSHDSVPPENQSAAKQAWESFKKLGVPSGAKKKKQAKPKSILCLEHVVQCLETPPLLMCLMNKAELGSTLVHLVEKGIVTGLRFDKVLLEEFLSKSPNDPELLYLPSGAKRLRRLREKVENEKSRFNTSVSDEDSEYESMSQFDKGKSKGVVEWTLHGIGCIQNEELGTSRTPDIVDICGTPGTEVCKYDKGSLTAKSKNTRTRILMEMEWSEAKRTTPGKHRFNLHTDSPKNDGARGTKRKHQDTTADSEQKETETELAQGEKE